MALPGLQHLSLNERPRAPEPTSAKRTVAEALEGEEGPESTCPITLEDGNIGDEMWGLPGDDKHLYDPEALYKALMNDRRNPLTRDPVTDEEIHDLYNYLLGQGKNVKAPRGPPEATRALEDEWGSTMAILRRLEALAQRGGDIFDSFWRGGNGPEVTDAIDALPELIRRMVDAQLWEVYQEMSCVELLGAVLFTAATLASDNWSSASTALATTLNATTALDTAGLTTALQTHNGPSPNAIPLLDRVVRTIAHMCYLTPTMRQTMRAMGIVELLVDALGLNHQTMWTNNWWRALRVVVDDRPGDVAGTIVGFRVLVNSDNFKKTVTAILRRAVAGAAATIAHHTRAAGLAMFHSNRTIYQVSLFLSNICETLRSTEDGWIPMFQLMSGGEGDGTFLDAISRAIDPSLQNEAWSVTPEERTTWTDTLTLKELFIVTQHALWITMSEIVSDLPHPMVVPSKAPEVLLEQYHGLVDAALRTLTGVAPRLDPTRPDYHFCFRVCRCAVAVLWSLMPTVGVLAHIKRPGDAALSRESLLGVLTPLVAAASDPRYRQYATPTIDMVYQLLTQLWQASLDLHDPEVAREMWRGKKEDRLQKVYQALTDSVELLSTDPQKPVRWELMSVFQP